MSAQLPKLGQILDLKKWQHLQDSLAKVTGPAIITVDFKGVPITEHSGRQPFCSYVRSKPELCGFCQKCDSHGGLEAVRLGKPYIYLCHCNIVDIAIPIIVDRQYIGAVMAGQIKLKEKSEEETLETILHSPLASTGSKEPLLQLYNEIPSMPLEKLSASVDMLSNVCNYIVEEAMSKNWLLSMYERMSDGRVQPPFPEDSSLHMIKSIQKDLSEAMVNMYIKTGSSQPPSVNNKILQPLFDYMYRHKSEMVTQKKAAELCHISTGYFSRLFTRETGESFSRYFVRLKIEWAKQLLENTDLPVAQISDELGFNEPGYFIKLFRKFEGTTPTAYRRCFANS